jgi:P63C domain
MNKMLKAAYGSPDKPLKIGDFEIQCYVLDNEKRVLVQRGLTSALGMSTGGGTGGAQRIVQFVTSKSIIPFISSELRLRIENPIKFTTPSGTLAYGYEATILVDICDSVMESKKQGLLHKQQEHIAERAELLMRGFAKTGIIALVDEVTGFQKFREKDALQQFLEKFLQDEQAKWVKTFDDEFFEMIFKMKGWTWHYASTKKPQVVGHYINNFVYSRLGPKVLEELKDRNIDKGTGKKKGKQFQFLSTDYGHPKLKEHLTALVALGRASGFNWRNFNRMVERAFPKFGDTLRIDYPNEPVEID